MSKIPNPLSDEPDFDYIFKVVVLGDSGVGKTNILTRFTNNEFNSNSKTTIGVEFATKGVYIDNKYIKAQIWDTAGQEKFRAVTSVYYRGAMGALLVYDITKEQSFTNLQIWMRELYDNCDRGSMTVMLIGNKCDLEQMREVSAEKAKKFAEKNGIAFLEVSALDNINISEAFNDIITQIYNRTIRPSLTNVGNDSTDNSLPHVDTISIGPPEPDKKGVCSQC